MLSCEEVRGRLSEHLDGGGTRWERFVLRMHLAMCDECARVERSLRSTVSLLRALREDPPPEG